jgi:hypothetical protein
MQALFTFSTTVYLLIYAFEGALRYGLYNVGLDSVILLRDGLLTVPLAVLLVTQAFRLRVHPAFFVFAGIIALHGTIATLNLHSTLPAVYGIKLLVNVLFGFIVSRQLLQPTRRLAWLFALVWVISVVGIVLDKFVYAFPWMGLVTNIGGIQVDVSRSTSPEIQEIVPGRGSSTSRPAGELHPRSLDRLGVHRGCVLVLTSGAVALSTRGRTVAVGSA